MGQLKELSLDGRVKRQRTVGRHRKGSQLIPDGSAAVQFLVLVVGFLCLFVLRATD